MNVDWWTYSGGVFSFQSIGPSQKSDRHRGSLSLQECLGRKGIGEKFRRPEFRQYAKFPERQQLPKDARKRQQPLSVLSSSTPYVSLRICCPVLHSQPPIGRLHHGSDIKVCGVWPQRAS
jgi:hypothetical protein